MKYINRTKVVFLRQHLTGRVLDIARIYITTKWKSTKVASLVKQYGYSTSVMLDTNHVITTYNPKTFNRLKGKKPCPL